MKSRSLRPSLVHVPGGHRGTDAEHPLGHVGNSRIEPRQQAPVVGEDNPGVRRRDLREVERGTSLFGGGPQQQPPGQDGGQAQQHEYGGPACEPSIEGASRPGGKSPGAQAPEVQQEEAAALHDEGRVEEREEALRRVEDQIQQRDEEGRRHLPARRGGDVRGSVIMKNVNR